MKITPEAAAQWQVIKSEFSPRGQELLELLAHRVHERISRQEIGLESPTIPQLFIQHEEGLLFAWYRKNGNQCTVVGYDRRTRKEFSGWRNSKHPEFESTSVAYSAWKARNAIFAKLATGEGRRLFDEYWQKLAETPLVACPSLLKSKITENLWVSHVNGVVFGWFSETVDCFGKKQLSLIYVALRGFAPPLD